MPHAIWTGAISFGLVTIPVSLYSAEDKRELSFHQLDRRDLSPVRQKRVNAATGDEVPWEEIVKGYEIEKGTWVVLNEDDFRAADVEATQTVDLVAFVPAGSVGPEWFDKPYYLQPAKTGRKAYSLLRETLARTGRIGIARVVVRTRQHLAAIVPLGDMLVLEMLRWSHELRSADALDIPTAEDVTDAELKMAETLVASMEAEWDPSAYSDTYHDKLLELIRRKAATGEVSAPPPPSAIDTDTGEVVDIMALLRSSVERATGQPASEEPEAEAG